jgi:hypothetical protein
MHAQKKVSSFPLCLTIDSTARNSVAVKSCWNGFVGRPEKVFFNGPTDYKVLHKFIRDLSSHLVRHPSHPTTNPK